MSDLVYVVRTGDINEELRFSLRSLVNVPHGVVHISGFIPSWLNGNLNRIPVPGNPNKFRSAEANLQAAIDSPDVSDPFWLMNDDFFFLKPHKQMPLLHRGPLSEVIDRYTKRHPGDYLEAMKHAAGLLESMDVEEPTCWEMHAPLLVHKARMEDVLALRGKQNRYLLRTVYGNLMKLRGKRSEDVKVYRNTDRDLSAMKLVSTTDIGFMYQAPGRYIRSLFPESSGYER